MFNSPSPRHPDAVKLTIRHPAEVAFVTSTPLTISGGSGTYVGISQLARSMESRGIRVAMHVPRFWLPGVTAKRLIFNLRVASRLRAGGFGWVIGFDLDGFHYGRAKTAPLISAIKGVIADELENERGLVRAMLRVQAAFERLAVHRADVVLATSRYSRDRIASAYGVPVGKIGVVPEQIDVQDWMPNGHGALPMGTEPPAILTVAHMYPRKNLGVLLRAYSRLGDAGIPFQAWIVGDGPCRRGWERLRDSLKLAGRVEFLGRIPRSALARCYRRAAVFCLPSRQEGFGIVFLEAMACGIPIVASRAAAIPETVSDGEVGLLVDPQDPDALAHALARLLSDRDLRGKLAEAGRRRVEQFRPERVTALFLGTVESALAGRTAACKEIPLRAPADPGAGGAISPLTSEACRR